MLSTAKSWLRHCATSRKVAGSIPDGAIGIFHWHNPSGRSTALGSTYPLTEMSTRNISWRVKAVGAYGWQPYHLYVSTVLKSGSLKLLEPSRPVQACAPFTCYDYTASTVEEGLCVLLVWYWQGKTKIFGEGFVPVPPRPAQIPYGQACDRGRASSVTSRRLTA